MDAEAGAPDMSVSKRDLGTRLLARLGVLLFLLGVGSVSVWAVEVGSPIHWSGTTTLWDRKANTVELKGNAAVYQPGESITGDYIFLDQDRRTIYAKGNAVYITMDLVIHAGELHFNLDTKTGTIVNGRISNGQFLLMGERINKLSDKRFLTLQAEYTTCVDCPSSWAVQGEDVDVEFGGYIFMSSVTARISDVPAFWLPYFVLPAKKERQTGLLFPKFGSSTQHGFRFVQPFFWAINSWSDLTLSLGGYTTRGFRSELEARYMLTERSQARANIFYTGDGQVTAPVSNRWALSVAQTQELPFEVDQKLLFRDISDNRYFRDFGSEDIQGRADPALRTDLIFTRSSRLLDASVSFHRYKNLLSSNHLTGFDERTVQLLPRIIANTGAVPLWRTPFTAGLRVDAASFTRLSGSYDLHDVESERTSAGCAPSDYCAGIDPIRRGVRYGVVPSLYGTFHPGDLFTLVPSVEYRSFLYDFGRFDPNVPLMSRGYLLLQTEFAFELSKIYSEQASDGVRHSFRPFLVHSMIPYQQESRDHPFQRQINFRSGYVFDTYDVVPLSTSPSVISYFTPLGHSLRYGFRTHLTRKSGKSYSRFVELSAAQALNLLELNRSPAERVPLTRLETTLRTGFGGFSTQTTYNYYPDFERLPEIRQQLQADQPTRFPSQISPHELTTSLSYALDSSLQRYLFGWATTVTMSYSWNQLAARDTTIGAPPLSQIGVTLGVRFSDYLTASAGLGYHFAYVLRENPSIQESGYFNTRSIGMSYAGPSRCWKLDVSMNWTRAGANALTDWSLAGAFALNLTGEGFVTADQAAGVFGGAR